MTMMKRAMAKLAIVAGLLQAGGVQTADSPRTAAATVATVRVTDAWARATPPGTPVGAGYLTLHNTGGQALTLLTASSPRAERVELHETRADARGLSTMRPVKALPLPAGAALSFDAAARDSQWLGSGDGRFRSVQLSKHLSELLARSPTQEALSIDLF